MNVLAFDPGTGNNGTAYGVVQQVGGQVLYITHGTVPYQADASTLAALVHKHVPDAVGVEGVGAYLANRARATQVLATAFESGRIAGIMERAGTRVLVLPANDPSGANWRGHLTGVRTAGDKEVKSALKRILTGLPVRTNNHARDALGLAVVVASIARQHFRW